MLIESIIKELSRKSNTKDITMSKLAEFKSALNMSSHTEDQLEDLANAIISSISSDSTSERTALCLVDLYGAFVAMTSDLNEAVRQEANQPNNSTKNFTR